MNLPIAEIDPFNVGQPVAVDSFYSSALKGTTHIDILAKGHPDEVKV